MKTGMGVLQDSGVKSVQCSGHEAPKCFLLGIWVSVISSSVRMEVDPWPSSILEHITYLFIYFEYF